MKQTFLFLLVLALMISSAAALTNTSFNDQASEIINVHIDNSSETYNVTFLQKPYFLSAFLRVNTSNITTDGNKAKDTRTYNDAGSFSGECLTGLITSGTIHDTFYSLNSTNKPTKITISTYLNNAGSIITWYCKNNATGNYDSLTSNSGVNTNPTNYTYNIPAECTTGNNLEMRYDLVRNVGQSSCLFNSWIERQYPLFYNVSTGSSLIYNATTETNNQSIVNFTEAANLEISTSSLFLTFGGNALLDYTTNISLEYLYNKTINVTIYNNITMSLLDPVCTLNSATVQPKSELLYFNSSLENNLTCILTGYQSFSTILDPRSDAANYTMITALINLEILDEQTEEYVLGNTSLQFISTEYADIRYIINGTGNITDLPPTLYNIIYQNIGYTIRQYFHFVNQSTSLQLFLLNSSISETRSFIVEDETGNILEGAIVKILRSYVSNNTQVFKVVEMDKSNFNGVAVFTIDPDAKYKVIVEYQNQTVYVSAEDYKLSQTTYTLTASLLGDPTTDFFDTRGIYTRLDLASDNSSIDYTVNDAAGIISEFCLEVNLIDNTQSTGYTELCNSCLEALSGSILCNITAYSNQEVSIEAKGKIITDSGFEAYTDTAVYTMYKPGKESFGILGVLLSFMIIASFFFAGFSIAGLQGAIAGIDLGFIISSMLQLLFIPLELLVGIIALSGFILWMVSD